MEFVHRHNWDLTPAQAVQLQKQLAGSIELRRPSAKIQKIAACDVSFDRGGEYLFAAVAVFDAESLELLDEVSVIEAAVFPYIPGLLSFRELPAVLKGFEEIRVVPDLVICDGQGIAHPRRLGIASHLGLWLNIPTIGSAKSVLCGKYDEPDEERGSRSPMFHHNEIIGYALRTRKGVKPVFVSPGHLCDLDSATDIILKLSKKYRLPDPIRYVHNLSNHARRQSLPGSQPAFEASPD